MAKRSKTQAGETPSPPDTAKPPTTKPRRRAKRATPGRKRHALLVLGMHRSGTSAMAGVLNLLGASIPRNLMTLQEENASGFFESKDLVVVHDELLASAGLAWDDTGPLSADWYHSPTAEYFEQRLLAFLKDNFAESYLLVVKDPRICRFAPLWLSALAKFKAEPHAVIIIRNPLEVAASLKARDGFVPGKSYLLWLRHVLDAERDTRGVSRSFVTYDSLLSDWRRVADTLSEDLGMKWPRTSHRAGVEIDQFLTLSHRHHSFDESVFRARPEVVDWWVKRAYETLVGMPQGGDDKAARRALDQIANGLASADLAFGPVVTAQKLALQDYQAAKDRLSGELEAAQAGIAERDKEVKRLGSVVGEREGEIARLSGELEAAQAGIAERDKEAKRLGSVVGRRTVQDRRTG